jgi:hypothetical protein
MLPLVLVGLVIWIAISVAVALLFVRILNLEEGEDSPASQLGDGGLGEVDLPSHRARSVQPHRQGGEALQRVVANAGRGAGQLDRLDLGGERAQ